MSYDRIDLEEWQEISRALQEQKNYRSPEYDPAEVAEALAERAPDPAMEELARRERDCPKGMPMEKWVVMNRRERRNFTRGRR